MCAGRNRGISSLRRKEPHLPALPPGILERDRFVFQTCARFGAPVAAAIGGGYQRDHERIVDRHMLLHRAAAEHAEQLLAACGTVAARAAVGRQTGAP